MIKKLCLVVALSGFCSPVQGMWSVWQQFNNLVQKNLYVSGAVGALGIAGLVYVMHSSKNDSAETNLHENGKCEQIVQQELTPLQQFKNALDNQNFEDARKLLSPVLAKEEIRCFQEMFFALAFRYEHEFLKILLESGLVYVNCTRFQCPGGQYISYKVNPLTCAIGIWTVTHSFLTGNNAGCFNEKRIKTLAVLLDHDADINDKDYSGNIPLHLAVETNKLDAVSLLLEYGPDYTLLNGKNKTAFDCVGPMDTEVADLLVLATGEEHPYMSLPVRHSFIFRNMLNPNFGLQGLDKELERFYDRAIFRNPDEAKRAIAYFSISPHFYDELLMSFGFLQGDALNDFFNEKTIGSMMRLRNIKALEFVLPAGIATGNVKVFEDAVKKLYCKPLKAHIEHIIFKAKRVDQFQKVLCALKGKKMVDLHWQWL